MSLETEQVLKEAGTVTNVKSRGRMTQKAKRYLRFQERQSIQDELDQLDKTLDPLNIRISRMSEGNVSEARRAQMNLKNKLEDESPPTDLSEETKNAAFRRLRDLESKYRACMQPQEVMRRNPVGAVDRFMKGENSPAMKAVALEIKNLRLLVDPESTDQDICNLENLRPTMARGDGTATFMAESQIPGIFAMTPQAKENWPENMPEYGTVNHPMRQAEQRELREKIAALEAELSEARKAPEPKAAKPDRPKMPEVFWTCPDCSESVSTRKKGMHIARHRRGLIPKGV